VSRSFEPIPRSSCGLSQLQGVCAPALHQARRLSMFSGLDSIIYDLNADNSSIADLTTAAATALSVAGSQSFPFAGFARRGKEAPRFG